MIMRKNGMLRRKIVAADRLCGLYDPNRLQSGVCLVFFEALC
jgi:hypothetical protein